MNRSLEQAILRSRGKQAWARWRHKLELRTLRRFTFAERVKILLGYNLDCHVSLLTEHGAGRCAERIVHTVTKANSQESAAREEM